MVLIDEFYLSFFCEYVVVRRYGFLFLFVFVLTFCCILVLVPLFHSIGVFTLLVSTVKSIRTFHNPVPVYDDFIFTYSYFLFCEVYCASIVTRFDKGK